MTDLNVQSIMEKFVRAFDPERAAGFDVKVQFHLSGNQVGDWVVTIRDQKLAVESGTTPAPNLTFSADSQEVLNVLTGKLNPMQAYMQGKIQFTGDMGLAMRLMSIFRRAE